MELQEREFELDSLKQEIKEMVVVRKNTDQSKSKSSAGSQLSVISSVKRLKKSKVSARLAPPRTIEIEKV
jgi:hypothetical protein